jgi:hypothetical protein
VPPHAAREHVVPRHDDLHAGAMTLARASAGDHAENAKVKPM